MTPHRTDTLAGDGRAKEKRENPQTFLFIVRLLLSTPAQALQRPRHLAAKFILPGAGLCPSRGLLLLLVLVVVQDGGLADGHPDDRVVGLEARVAETLTGLGAQQHRGDVVDLVGGLRAGALLRDAAALVPAPLGIQSHHEDQEEQEQRNQPTLRRRAKSMGQERHSDGSGDAAASVHGPSPLPPLEHSFINTPRTACRRVQSTHLWGRTSRAGGAGCRRCPLAGDSTETPPAQLCPLSRGLCSYHAPLGSPQPPSSPTRRVARGG